MRFLIISKWPPCTMALLISERLAGWKRDSLTSANLSCMTALLISQRLAGWKRDSLTSANLSCMTALLISQRLAAWKSDSWESANRPSSRNFYTCLSIWRTENANPEHQKWQPFTMHLLISKRLVGWNTIPDNQQIYNPARRYLPYNSVWQLGNAIPEHMQNDPCTTTLPISERLAAWKLHPGHQQIDPPLQKPWPHLCFYCLKTRFLNIRKWLLC